MKRRAFVEGEETHDSFLVPSVFSDANLTDETLKVARTKEEEFFQKIHEYVVPAAMNFTECINYVTTLHSLLELPREVLFLALEVLQRYLAKEYLSMRGNRLPRRIPCTCILLAAKFILGEGKSLRKRITTNSKLKRKILLETERKVLCAIEHRFNWWNDYFFLTYYAKRNNTSSKAMSLAELVLLAAHHSRKVHHIKGSVNATVCLNIATELIAFSGARGLPLKRRRPDAVIFHPEKEDLVSTAEMAKLKSRIIETIQECKMKETHVYDMLLKELCIDPLEILQCVPLNKKQL